MDSDYGNKYSFSGFIDYSKCFGEYDLVWTICGCFIFLGTLISYQPQNYAIISSKSNYGINPFMLFVTNLGQGLVFFNIICLHASDFAGLFMRKSYDIHHSIKVLSTFLTVCNMALDWYTYKFVCVLNFIFIDLIPRAKRGSLAVKREAFIAPLLYGISMLFEHILFVIYISIGVFIGFQSPTIRIFAQVCSILSSVCFAIQYIPQMVTTCCLKERGSYSLITLGILLIGTTINFCFMFVGQGENWSTVLPVGVTIIEQLILFIICIHFICRKRKMAMEDEDVEKPLSEQPPPEKYDENEKGRHNSDISLDIKDTEHFDSEVLGE